MLKTLPMSDYKLPHGDLYQGDGTKKCFPTTVEIDRSHRERRGISGQMDLQTRLSTHKSYFFYNLITSFYFYLHCSCGLPAHQNSLTCCRDCRHRRPPALLHADSHFCAHLIKHITTLRVALNHGTVWGTDDPPQHRHLHLVYTSRQNHKMLCNGFSTKLKKPRQTLSEAAFTGHVYNILDLFSRQPVGRMWPFNSLFVAHWSIFSRCQVQKFHHEHSNPGCSNNQTDILLLRFKRCTDSPVLRLTLNNYNNTA